ncbi:MAG TPA: hypothetical protein VM142_01665 [Acidimicrobiales bacterium]|nr:hypothetical protein [Acidimicrobiales bacterium]
MSPFLTVEDLAARWRTTPHAVRNQKYRGLLPVPLRVGRRLLWDLADIEAFEAGRRETPVKSVGERDRFPKPTSWPAKSYKDWGKTG